MTRGARWFIALVGIVVLALAAGVASAAAALAASGSIAVRVESEEEDLSIRVPALAAHLALSLLPDRIWREALQDAPVELQRWLPVVRDAWSELRRAPDFVLVEAESDGGQIRIEKRDRMLLIQVEETGTDVHVAVPLATVSRLVRAL